MIFKKLSLFTVCIVLACLCLVSCGSTKIPEITNVDEMSAKNLLSSNGLISAIVYEYSDNVAEGYTIKTEPAIGTSVEKNSVVTIYISKGPELRVPDISNLDETAAQDVLFSNGFFSSISYEYSDDVKKGCVIRTEPEIDSTVEDNAIINIFVSCGRFYREPEEVIMSLDESISIESCKIYKEGDKLYINCHNFNFTPKGANQKSLCEWYDPENTSCIQGTVWWSNLFYGVQLPITTKYQARDLDDPSNRDFTIEVPWEINNSNPTNIEITLQLVYNGSIYNKKIELTILWILGEKAS